MTKIRKKIPEWIETAIMLKSERKCYCGKIGDHIHHIDSNPANNEFDNLILLCFDHHDDASVTGGLRKRPSPKQLKQMREELYLHNETKRNIELKHYASALKHLSQENVFKASLNASIVLEINQLRKIFLGKLDWKKINAVMLTDLSLYSKYTNLRIFEEVLDFLEDVAYYSREKISDYVVDSILHNIFLFFPQNTEPEEKPIIIDLLKRCANISSKISYDGFIHNNNMAVASSALRILQYIQLIANDKKIHEASTIVQNIYEDLERQLDRPERSDLEMAKRFLIAFKNGLINPSMLYPKMDVDMELRLEKDSENVSEI